MPHEREHYERSHSAECGGGEAALALEDVKILVAYHKATPMPEDTSGVLLPIHVGAAIADTALPMQRDDEVTGKPCDNISAKNKSWCELTAFYWAWRNLKALYPAVRYVGFWHYRRYMDLANHFSFNNYLFNRGFHKAFNELQSYKIDPKVLRRCLTGYDIILRKPSIQPHNLAQEYAQNQNSRDFRTMVKVILRLHPEYREVVERVLYRSKKFPSCNMAIMRWELFEQYCQWSFPILEECERLIDISSYDSQQSRIFGYMGERLLYVWSDYQRRRGARVKYLSLILFGGVTSHSGALWKALRYLWQARPHPIKALKTNLAFYLVRPSKKEVARTIERLLNS